MPLDRVLENEVMDSAAEACDYDAMDHAAVNRLFVDDLLIAIQGLFLPGSSSQESESEKTLDILDLGTGTAQIPIELCRRFQPCRVMAVDAAVSMLDLARYNLEVAGQTQRIQLAQVDAKSLPFDDGMFDIVMSNSIVHHVPHPMDVLREAVRVSRAGGLLFFRDLLRPSDAEQLQALVRLYAADANEHQRQMFADSLHAALSLAEIRDLVASLGFAEESVNPTSDRHWTWSGRVPSRG